ncbi:NERD domain-containing protein [bacterium LRH843]|nr:NERD domain-containing protein [bacterium LRH843]
MAHLIKLEDYISRYQFDLNRYPSQFSRMKKERWYYLKLEWEQLQSELEYTIEKDPRNEHEKRGFFKHAFSMMKIWGKSDQDQSDHAIEQLSDSGQRMKQMTFEQLKKSFLDELFQSQLRWASSSLLEESILHPRYKYDPWLRFFAQQLPDNYFFMYKPVFYIKQAAIELDLILISPTEIVCITLVEGKEHSIFEASSDRFWTEYIDKTRKKRISPLLSMSRMTGVIKGILEQEGSAFPIHQVVLSPTSMIDNKIQGAAVNLIDRRNFDSWHERLKKHPSPLKHEQMKVTSLLLNHCYTVSHKINEV